MTKEEIQTSEPKPESALKSFLSGGVGGVCAVLVGHPFDLVKVRMQTGGVGNASVFGILRKTFVTDGISGLYRGVSAPLAATTPMFAVCFWGFDMGKRIVRYSDSEYQGDNDIEAAANYTFSIPQYCVAGGISALPTTMIMAPSERLKCLLQVQANEIEKGGKAKYKGLSDCAMKVYQEGGIRSVYKGTGATLLRDVPGTAAWYGSYELAKKYLMQMQGIDPDSGKLPLMSIVGAGGLSGIVCWTISIPPDVLKSKFQTAPPGKYNGIYDVYRELMRTEGPKALFTGFRPAMMRAIPANAACFWGVEISRSFMSFLD